jgi:hypothetical protein
VWGFGGGKPETEVEADGLSGSFTALRFVQDDALFFNFGLVMVPARDDAFRGGKPETAAEADASSGSFTPFRMTGLGSVVKNLMLLRRSTGRRGPFSSLRSG